MTFRYVSFAIPICQLRHSCESRNPVDFRWHKCHGTGCNYGSGFPFPVFTRTCFAGMTQMSTRPSTLKYARRIVHPNVCARGESSVIPANTQIVILANTQIVIPAILESSFPRTLNSSSLRTLKSSFLRKQESSGLIPQNHSKGNPTAYHASTTHLNPRFPVELSGVFDVRAATRYRLQYESWHRYDPPRIVFATPDGGPCGLSRAPFMLPAST